ncbi:MAG TPA: CoA pyrophosphatase [Burkholderiales bacterium]|nr:CoA pyrophosphatase [Burkholderiales bacterium]
MVLDVPALKERLKQTPPAFSVYGDDDSGRLAAAIIAAAVLVPIVDRSSGLSVIFTQRTSHLKAHSGQVSFPGGRAEPSDATPEFTALREAHEEIGLPMERVEVLARLPEYLTRTGFRVTPVVGLITPPFDLVPDPREVEEVFEVPLAYLLDPSNHARETRELQGRTVGYYVVRYESRTIWGATAGMLMSLYRHLAR